MKANLLCMVTSLVVLGQAHAIISKDDLEDSFITQINKPVPLENITIRFTHLGIWKYTFHLTEGVLSLGNNKTTSGNCSLFIIRSKFKLVCTIDLSNSVAAYEVSKKNNWRLRWQHFGVNASITEGTLGLSLWLDKDTEEDAENIVCTVNVTRMSLMISPRRVSILPKVRAKFSERAATDIATKVKIGLENACMNASKRLREDWREDMLTESTEATDIASTTGEHTSDTTTASSIDETLTVVSSTVKTDENKTSGATPNANESDGSHDLTGTATTTKGDMNEATTFSSGKTSTVVQAGEINTSSPSPNVPDTVDLHEAKDTKATTDEDSKDTTNVSSSDKRPTPGYSTAQTSEENTSSPSPNADDTLGTDDTNDGTKTTDKDTTGATTISSTDETLTVLSSTSQTVEIKSSSATKKTKTPDDQSSTPTEDVEHC